MLSSNEKAYMLSQLGLVSLSDMDDMNRVTEATVPAQGGEYATVRFDRDNQGAIKVVSCLHTPFGGGIASNCQAVAKGNLCYHAKAVIVEIGQTRGEKVVFFQEEGEAKQLQQDVQGLEIQCLYVTQRSVQWFAYLPHSIPDPEEIIRQQEVIHLRRVAEAILARKK